MKTEGASKTEEEAAKEEKAGGSPARVSERKT